MRYTGDYEINYATEGSAGIDLRNNGETVEIMPNTSAIIGTGIKVAIPKGFVGLLFIRSSMGFKYDLTLSNAVGVIDADFRGEIKAKVFNHSKDIQVIKNQERFCQLVIMPTERVALQKVDTLEKTSRGEGGFGSTGRL